MFYNIDIAHNWTCPSTILFQKKKLLLVVDVLELDNVCIANLFKDAYDSTAAKREISKLKPNGLYDVSYISTKK